MSAQKGFSIKPPTILGTLRHPKRQFLCGDDDRCWITWRWWPNLLPRKCLTRVMVVAAIVAYIRERNLWRNWILNLMTCCWRGVKDRLVQVVLHLRPLTRREEGKKGLTHFRVFRELSSRVLTLYRLSCSGWWLPVYRPNWILGVCVGCRRRA